MIVHLANKTRFRADILKERGRLAHETFQSALGKSVGASELASWKNSLRHMDKDLPAPIDLCVQALSVALLDTGV
jgi:hypothetical protein